MGDSSAKTVLSLFVTKSMLSCLLSGTFVPLVFLMFLVNLVLFRPFISPSFCFKSDVVLV